VFRTFIYYRYERLALCLQHPTSRAGPALPGSTAGRIVVALRRNGVELWDFGGQREMRSAGADPRGAAARAAGHGGREADGVGDHSRHGRARAWIDGRPIELARLEIDLLIALIEVVLSDTDAGIRRCPARVRARRRHDRDKTLESGGELYADVTTGFDPECFEIQGAPTAGPYHLSVHDYAQGPMGYSMGLVQIVRFDGKAFSFEDRPT
jgi:hypothetical protein